MAVHGCASSPRHFAVSSLMLLMLTWHSGERLRETGLGESNCSLAIVKCLQLCYCGIVLKNCDGVVLADWCRWIGNKFATSISVKSPWKPKAKEIPLVVYLGRAHLLAPCYGHALNKAYVNELLNLVWKIGQFIVPTSCGKHVVNYVT